MHLIRQFFPECPMYFFLLSKCVQNIRYRAFPARLVKLYEYISKDQQAMIFDAKGSGNWRALKRGAQ